MYLGVPPSHSRPSPLDRSPDDASSSDATRGSGHLSTPRVARAGVTRLFGRLGRAAAILGLASAATAFAHFAISWEDNSSDEDGFIIERSTNGGGFGEIGRVGANVTTFTDSTIVVGTAYQYRVAAYNSVGLSFYSNVATNAPTFTTQPASQAASALQSVTFTAVADGIPAPTYQWRKDGQALTDAAGHIAGATTGTLVLTNVTNADLGNYTVVASNGISPAATSSVAALTVQRAAQTITFGALPTATFGDGSLALTATSTSGLPITYTSSNPAVATVSGNSLSILGVGTAVITATQPGDGTYLAASNVTQTLTVAKAPQTISFDPISGATYGDGPIALSATTSSGLPLTFVSLNTNIATVNGNVVTIVAAGNATLVARQAGNTSYLAASDVSQTLTIGKKSQTLTFTVPATMVLGDPAFTPYTLTGSSDSGLPVSYGSSQLSIAKVSGNTLNLVGSGSVNITASQPGNNNYFAATPIVLPVVVNKAPTFTLNPTNATVSPNFQVTFTVSASALPTATYQWQVSTNGGSSWSDLVNGAPYSNVTTASLTINPATAAMNGNQYRAVATNSVASNPSNAATLTVNFAPSVTTAPANTFAPTGGNATFSVVAAGNPAPTYQWQVKSTAAGSSFVNLTNDTTYSGATAATLTVSGATAGLNNFQYRCVVTNSVSSATSTAAILTVGNVAPAIATNPASQTVIAGTNAAFTVGATGGPAPTYQWQSSPDGTNWSNLSDSGTYSGTTTATLTVISAPPTASGRQFRAIATNPAGSATSTAATLTVTSVAPTISSQPTSQTAAAGNSVTFTVTATGNPAPAYQWQSSPDGTNWTNLTASTIYTGVTTPTLTVTDVSGLDGTKFRCVVTNGATPDAISNVATLTVLTNLAPSFTTQPANATPAIGGNASFSVAVIGTAPIALKWQVSTNGGNAWTDVTAGGPYAGVTTATLQITGVTAAMNAYQYRAVASNVAAPAGVTSNAATLAVISVAPVFTTQPTSQSITVGNSATFTATATGNPAPSFQWQVSTDGGTTWNFVTNGAPYSGATTSTLTITGAALTLSGYKYQCIASNVAAAVGSDVVTLAVTAPVVPPPAGGGGGGVPPPANSGPLILVQPTSQTANVNGSVTFTVIAAGTPAPTYQWRFNGSAVSGATNSTYTRSDLQATDAGNYDVVVTNIVGTATSAAAVLTVNSKPVIVIQPTGATTGIGSSVTFTVGAIGSAPLTYQWRFNGASIAGATSASYNVASVQSTSAGAYDVVVTNSLGYTTSNAALLGLNSYVGEYFGTLSGGGSWALHVRADGTGTYIAYLPDRRTAIVLQVTIDSSGSFTAVGTELQAGTTPQDAGVIHRAAAVATFTLSGSISKGSVTGQLSGIGQSLSGSLDQGSSRSGGLYTAAAVAAASSGTTYSIVGPSGRTLLVTSTTSGVDGASGTLNSGGELTTTSSAGAQVSVALTANSSLTATYTPAGSTPIKFSGVADTVTVTTRLVNLSARSPAGSGSGTLIAGFSVSGSGSKSLLIRAVGPGLSAYGVTSPLADPVLSLYSGQTVTATNDNWSTATNASEAARIAGTVGAFALTPNSLDSALLTSVNPAGYTAQVSGGGTSNGVALVEIYDAGASSARLTNVSARAQVGTGANVFIIGFTVEGNAPKQYLVRAIGPTLGTFGVTGVLADPQLAIMRQGTSTALATNDDWAGSTALKNAFVSVGAFSLADTSKDAAIIITLEPGSYSAVASGTNGTTGVALIELYELP